MHPLPPVAYMYRAGIHCPQCTAHAVDHDAALCPAFILPGDLRGRVACDTCHGAIA